MNYPTLKKFLDDPSYVDNENYGTRWADKRRYDTRWEYMQKLFKEFPITYFKESDYSYYIHIEVPSEMRGNTYDVVLHFFTQLDNIAARSDLRDYNIRIFSNNPVFGFHFGHANYTKGILIDFLADKFPRDILENKAEKYNPKDAIGYCHSLYFAGKYLLDKPRYLNKTFIEGKCLSFNKSNLHAMCRHMEQSMEEYRGIKDRTDIKKRFNERADLSKRIDDTVKDAKAKLDEYRQKTGDALDKINPSKYIGSSKSGVNRITAKKSNVSKKSSSGVRRITARKK